MNLGPWDAFHGVLLLCFIGLLSVPNIKLLLGYTKITIQHNMNYIYLKKNVASIKDDYNLNCEFEITTIFFHEFI